MTILPLVVAAVLGAKYFEGDPLNYTSGQKSVPLAEGSPVSCELCYSSASLDFVFRAPGEPAGRFVLQVRPGARNVSAPLAPFACEIEVAPKGRVTDLLAPTAHSRLTPHFPPVIGWKTDAKGWAMRVSFPFHGRLGRFWPVCEGAKRPANWQATVRYVDAVGKATDFGTSDDPLQIAWGRTPPWKAGRDGLLKDHELVEAYRGMRAKYCDIYDYSQKERWIGYLDPGVETFAWRQADSEKLFFGAYAAAIANEYDEAMKLLEYGLDDHGRRWIAPKSLKLGDPAKDRLVRMVDDMNYACEAFTAARLEYLRDRFMGRKVKEAAKVKAKRAKSVESQLKAPDASVEEGALTLDDEQLQF